MKRRDFLKTGGVAASALLVGASPAEQHTPVLKLPFRGAMYQRMNGELILVGRGLVYSTSHDAGISWSRPRLFMNRGEAIQSESHVLGLRRLRSGKVALMYGRRQRVNNYHRQEIFFRTSDDDGQTWSPENSVTPLPGDDLYALHGSLVELSSGRLILPAYTHFSHEYIGRPRNAGDTWLPHYNATHMLISDDEGVTWEPTNGLYLWKDFGHGGIASCGEACLAETKDGRLLMLARTTNMRALRSYSDDGGETWTYVELTDLSSSDAPIRLTRIPKSGDLLIVWNQATASEQRSGYGYSRLSCAVSKDSGKSWEHFRTLELCPGMATDDRVDDPEPPQFVRAGENTSPGQVPNNSVRGIVRSSYANVHFVGDRVLVDHEHWWTPNLWAGKGARRDAYQKLQILPLNWFYGGTKS